MPKSSKRFRVLLSLRIDLLTLIVHEVLLKLGLLLRLGVVEGVEQILSEGAKAIRHGHLNFGLRVVRQSIEQALQVRRYELLDVDRLAFSQTFTTTIKVVFEFLPLRIPVRLIDFWNSEVGRPFREVDSVCDSGVLETECLSL
jgi:hypothetical protein